MTLESLRDVLSSDYKGPRAVFSEVHVLKAILAIGAAGSVGRGRLGSLVGLGQGEVRTLIKRMKENDLIVIEPDGCKLSRKGEREFSQLKEKLPWSSKVEAGSLGIGAECAAVLVRGAGANVRKGIEQRDAAVRVGRERGADRALREGPLHAPRGGDRLREGRASRPMEGGQGGRAEGGGRHHSRRRGLPRRRRARDARRGADPLLGPLAPVIRMPIGGWREP